MSNNPTIQEQNNDIVKDFFAGNGPETKQKITSFILELSLYFIERCSETNYTDEYLGEVTCNFRVLNDLVTGLQDPSASPSKS